MRHVLTLAVTLLAGYLIVDAALDARRQIERERHRRRIERERVAMRRAAYPPRSIP